MMQNGQMARVPKVESVDNMIKNMQNLVQGTDHIYINNEYIYILYTGRFQLLDLSFWSGEKITELNH